jgi:hypothetical protein
LRMLSAIAPTVASASYSSSLSVKSANDSIPGNVEPAGLGAASFHSSSCGLSSEGVRAPRPPLLPAVPPAAPAEVVVPGNSCKELPNGETGPPRLVSRESNVIMPGDGRVAHKSPGVMPAVLGPPCINTCKGTSSVNYSRTQLADFSCPEFSTPIYLEYFSWQCDGWGSCSACHPSLCSGFCRAHTGQFA